MTSRPSQDIPTAPGRNVREQVVDAPEAFAVEVRAWQLADPLRLGGDQPRHGAGNPAEAVRLRLPVEAVAGLVGRVRPTRVLKWIAVIAKSLGL